MTTLIKAIRNVWGNYGLYVGRKKVRIRGVCGLLRKCSDVTQQEIDDLGKRLNENK